MKKGNPFLEIFASALHEDYRFPILEIFAFLYALGTFAFANLTALRAPSEEAMAYFLVSSLMSVPLFIFIILVFKNVAYGLGGDLEKGTIQTFLSYPLKRRNILTAKLLSAIGVALLLFFGMQVIALLVLAPGMVLSNITVVLLSYIANCGYVFLLTAIILLIALFIRKGGTALIMGIVLWFALGIASSLVLFFAVITGLALPLQIISLLNPSTALSAHYGGLRAAFFNVPWEPTLTEAAFYIVGNYVIVAFLFFLAYYYFSRRLSI
ncbi:MAG: ABC transporter permease [Candidatus Bathyarchaeia archaeon]|nr:ABC transporter permease subunit [Candidatus Bathyarchaeota archaeon A05DMB-4]MDH7595601.1 ABC transporter permease [Candidatus Bathyarchaeota archaeon]